MMILSLYKTGKSRIIIREARKEDEQELAVLAYKCYYNRFFNDEVTSKKGGSLRRYSELVPDDDNDLGQNLKSFQSYWRKAMPNLGKEFICLVAEQFDERGRKPIGFVKGYAAPAEVVFLKGKIGELGSLYVDPDCQHSKVGKFLIKFYSQKMRDCGYDGMITRCYSKNNSQRFFAKMGAKLVGSCKILNKYRKGNGEEGGCYIPGDVMFWNNKSLDKLSGVDVLQIPKGRDIWGNIAGAENRQKVDCGRGC